MMMKFNVMQNNIKRHTITVKENPYYISLERIHFCFIIHTVAGSVHGRRSPSIDD